MPGNPARPGGKPGVPGGTMPGGKPGIPGIPGIPPLAACCFMKIKIISLQHFVEFTYVYA